MRYNVTNFLLASNKKRMRSSSQNPTIDFNAIKQLSSLEAKAVDQLIVEELRSDVVLINEIGRYIINNGGKRLRPMLLLLAAKALGEVDRKSVV